MYSEQFEQTKDQERIAYKCCMAIWNNDGKHVIIAAPDLGRLIKRWKEITGLELDTTIIHNILVVKQ